MTEIFCLFLGEYDEQQPLGMFSTREKAELVQEAYLAADRGSDDLIQLETYQLDAGVELLQSGKRLWILRMTESGEIVEASTVDFRYKDFLNQTPEFYDRKDSLLCRYYQTNDLPYPRFYARLWAFSKEEAIDELKKFRVQAMMND